MGHLGYTPVGCDVKSKGSRAFAAMPGSVRDKAIKFNGGKTAAVYSWIRGEYAPAEAKQFEIEDAGGPPATWWDEPDAALDASSAVAAAVAPVSGSASPAGIASEADMMLADVQTLRQHVSGLEGDPAEKIRNLEKLSSMLVALSKMRGVLMSERQILSSPHWSAVEARILEALEPWPDAMRAVATELEAGRAP